MDQPEGFVIPSQEQKIYKIDKSLYGLKQEPWQWHENFENFVTNVNESKWK